MLDKPMAFTLASQGILQTLETNALITSKYIEKNTSYDLTIRNVLWDTGASKSTISPRVVNDLNLTPMGICTLSTANGLVQAKTYVVDIGLPNKVTIKDVMVSCADIGDNIDALIGMDIITLGDFSVTNVNGKTKFSFRIPSVKAIDYVKEDV